jgi:isovaleryl-CoA dehydrogenase
VRVPAANLVGQEGGAVKCMMRNLEIERLALAAMSCGIARRCIEVTTAARQSTRARAHARANFTPGHVRRAF